MSLDQNLFTLNIAQRVTEPHIIELIDPSETVHYRKERTNDGGYSFNLYGKRFLRWITTQILTSLFRVRPDNVVSILHDAGFADPMSESLLATVTAPSATSKQKTIELHNPFAKVELKFSGTLCVSALFRTGSDG